jgi:hypothetical protein
MIWLSDLEPLFVCKARGKRGERAVGLQLEPTAGCGDGAIEVAFSECGELRSV